MKFSPILTSLLLYAGTANADHLDFAYQSNNKTQGGRLEMGFSAINTHSYPLNLDGHGIFGLAVSKHKDYDNEYKVPFTLGAGLEASIYKIGIFGKLAYAPIGYIDPSQGHGWFSEVGISMDLEGIFQEPFNKIEPYISRGFVAPRNQEGRFAEQGERLGDLDSTWYIGFKVN